MHEVNVRKLNYVTNVLTKTLSDFVYTKSVLEKVTISLMSLQRRCQILPGMQILLQFCFKS